VIRTTRFILTVEIILVSGLNGSYILAKSCKQQSGSTSSTDAEIIALVDSLKVVVWLKNVLTELDIVQVNAAIVSQDNKSAMIMVNDISKCKRSKHMLTKINYAKDLVNSGIIKIIYLETTIMSADLLTN